MSVSETHTPDKPDDNAFVPPKPEITSFRFLSGLAILAALVSGYLLVMSLSQQGTPLGCGPNSGCDAVLSSKWASFFGIPVTVFAIIADLSVIGLGRLPTRHQRAGAYLLAGLFLSAAVWFLGLQLFVVKAFCVYCSISHFLGIGLALLLLRPLTPKPKLVICFTTGCLLTIGLAALQMGAPEPAPNAFLPATATDQDQRGSSRRITLLDGILTVDVAHAWVLGDPEAPTPIVVLFDHACPHCRTTHTVIQAAIEQDPTLCAVMLPMPMSLACNPKGMADDESGGRFADSCDRSALAVAVQQAAGVQAASVFNEWLLQQHPAPSSQAARQKASEIIGEDALQQARDAPGPQRILQSVIDAFNATDELDRLPVVMSPGKPTTGALKSPEALTRWLAMTDGE